MRPGMQLGGPAGAAGAVIMARSRASRVMPPLEHDAGDIAADQFCD
jgi:hypothetical protein